MKGVNICYLLTACQYRVTIHLHLHVFVVQNTVFITIHHKTRISKHLVNELNGFKLIGFGPYHTFSFCATKLIKRLASPDEFIY